MKVIVAKTEEEKRLSYWLRFETMCRELGWLNAEDYSAGEEKDEYDNGQSMIFLALDDSGKAIGTTRLILRGELPFPVKKYFSLYEEELIEALHGKMENCVEASRFVVPRNSLYRRHEITQLLYTTMIKKCALMGATHMFMSADHRFFRLLKILGLQLHEIGEPKFYMGSKTTPGILSIAHYYDKQTIESLVPEEAPSEHAIMV